MQSANHILPLSQNLQWLFLKPSVAAFNDGCSTICVIPILYVLSSAELLSLVLFLSSPFDSVELEPPLPHAASIITNPNNRNESFFILRFTNNPPDFYLYYLSHFTPAKCERIAILSLLSMFVNNIMNVLTFKFDVTFYFFI